MEVVIAIGDVVYGNVGSRQRLDFTVTGTAVNVAARLSAQCKQVDKQLLVSAEVAACVPQDLNSLGIQEMKSLQNDLEVYALGTL